MDTRDAPIDKRDGQEPRSGEGVRFLIGGGDEKFFKSLFNFRKVSLAFPN